MIQYAIIYTEDRTSMADFTIQNMCDKQRL